MAMVTRRTFKGVVQPSLQAVVSIYTTAKAKAPAETKKFQFGPFRFEMPSPDGNQSQPRQALGSGVIVRKDGLVITNNHVIQSADEIKVVLHDGRTFDAEVVITEADCDLAAIRFIKTSKNSHFFEGDFPIIDLGMGHECEVGDVCFAIGNNLGLQGTVTQGIISAVGRFLGKPDRDSSRKIRVPLIQTSASINPGSSGGALVDTSGKLVGINTAIITPSRGNVGLAFAVPANYILPVLAAVDAKELKVQRPYIGLTLGKNSWPNKGIWVHGVLEGGPAAAGGVKAKDVITKLNGVPVNDSDRFLMMIAVQKIGSTIELTVNREKSQTTARVKVGVWKPPAEKLLVIKDQGAPMEGTTLAEMNPSLNSELGLDSQLRGVVVTKVLPGSASIGLFRRGDRILQIGSAAIKSLDDVSKAIANENLSKLSDSTLKIRVARGNVVIEFRLRMGPIQSKL